MINVWCLINYFTPRRFARARRVQTARASKVAPVHCAGRLTHPMWLTTSATVISLGDKVVAAAYKVGYCAGRRHKACRCEIVQIDIPVARYRIFSSNSRVTAHGAMMVMRQLSFASATQWRGCSSRSVLAKVFAYILGLNGDTVRAACAFLCHTLGHPFVIRLCFVRPKMNRFG